MSSHGDLPPELVEQLKSTGQAHLVTVLEELGPPARGALLNQLRQIDLEQLQRLQADPLSGTDPRELASEATPPPAFRLDGRGARFTAEEAIARGEAALRGAKIGTILVAGGQGTRLGFPHPKGMYDLKLPSGRTLFQIFVDRILAVGKRYGVGIPLYLMTSPATHDETGAYFEQRDNLGLGDDLTIFCQGTMPAVDAVTGQLLLASPQSLALSPDGHGGTLAALAKHGCLDNAQSRGIEQLFYFQVDNPLSQICDPEFIGYHLLSESELTTQVVAKQRPEEKVGVAVQIGDEVRILEYSNLTEEATRRTDETGGLALWAGNTAVHVFNLQFLQRMVEQAGTLPYHRARKKVPYIDESGTLVETDEPNAIKFERFIFDLLPHAKNAVVVEVDPACGFAPVKNEPGAATDSPETSRAAILALHRRWLEAAGADVAGDAEIELGPTFALNQEDVTRRIESGQGFAETAYLA